MNCSRICHRWHFYWWCNTDVDCTTHLFAAPFFVAAAKQNSVQESSKTFHRRWFLVLAFWREAKVSNNQRVDSFDRKYRANMSSYLKEHKQKKQGICFMHIFMQWIYIYKYICMYFGGFFEIFVFKQFSQISEFKCAVLKDDSGKPLKTSIKWSGEKRYIKRHEY